MKMVQCKVLVVREEEAGAELFHMLQGSLEAPWTLHSGGMMTESYASQTGHDVQELHAGRTVSGCARASRGGSDIVGTAGAEVGEGR